MDTTGDLIQKMENYCEVSLGKDENSGKSFSLEICLLTKGIRAHGGKAQAFKERK